MHDSDWSGPDFELDATPRAVLAPAGGFVRVNAAFASLVGRPGGELIDTGWRELIHKRDRTRVSACLVEAFLSPRGAVTFEAALTNELQVHFRLQLLRDAANRPDAWLLEGRIAVI